MASAVVKNNQNPQKTVLSQRSKNSLVLSTDEMYNNTDNIHENILINNAKQQQQQTSKEQEAKYPITTDLKNLFGLIEKFHAKRIEIKPFLQPFLIDYIPAIGDVDPFIKIPRPDDVSNVILLIILLFN